MLAATVGIDAGFEADVRAIVVRDYRARAVAQKLSARQRIFLGIPIGIRFEMNLLEAIRRIGCRATVCGGEAIGGGDGRGSVQYSVFSF